jgi:CHRD domain
MRSLRVKLAIGVATLGVVVITAAAVAGDRGKIRTSLTGYEEVPAISTEGSGSFKASLSGSGTELRYELRYADLEGGAPTQAHLHFAQKSVNGGIVVWLCGTTANPGPAGTQACPTTPSGTITGTISAANVVAPAPAPPANQGIEAGAFDELVAGLRAGTVYANVHTATFPGGEIRGQLDDHKRGHDRDHDD